jgi:hypothetical protein
METPSLQTLERTQKQQRKKTQEIQIQIQRGKTFYLNDLAEKIYVSEKKVAENKWGRRSTRTAF